MWRSKKKLTKYKTTYFPNYRNKYIITTTNIHNLILSCVNLVCIQKPAYEYIEAKNAS